MTDVSDVMELIAASRIVPVVVLEHAAEAQRLGDALAGGGMGVIEVTLRTAAGSDAIRALAEAENIVVGAGSVLTSAQVDLVVDAGAQFIVSPGFSRSVVDRAHTRGVRVIPGVATASEILAALEAGVDVVKLFPAETLGGTAAVRALSAPFPDLKLIPTGGVTPKNLEGYLKEPAVLAVGGSWMAEQSLMAEGQWDEIRRRARAAADTVAQVRLGDVA